MSTLAHQLGRTARLVPLEVRTRWHAARLLRHDRLRREHKVALDQCMTEVRSMLADR